jgi:hypothetical protein
MHDSQEIISCFSYDIYIIHQYNHRRPCGYFSDREKQNFQWICVYLIQTHEVMCKKKEQMND